MLLKELRKRQLMLGMLEMKDKKRLDQLKKLTEKLMKRIKKQETIMLQVNHCVSLLKRVKLLLLM